MTILSARAAQALEVLAEELPDLFLIQLGDACPSISICRWHEGGWRGRGGGEGPRETITEAFLDALEDFDAANARILGRMRAEELRALRARRGLTQKQAADRMGINVGDVRAMERGKRPMSPEEHARLWPGKTGGAS